MRRALLLFVVLGLAAGSARAEPLSELDRLQFADGLHSRALFELALREYEGIVRDFPDTPRADSIHFRMGECFRGMNKPDDAAKQFSLVFGTYTNSDLRFKAGYKQATVVQEMGQAEGALVLFHDLLQAGPPPDIASGALYASGEIHEKAGRTDEATRAYEQIRDQYGTGAFASYALLKLGGLYAANTGTVDRALEMLRLAAEKPATERIGAEALFQAAELTFARRTFDQSAAAYKKLLADYPTHELAVAARLRAAWACHHAGLYADGLAIAEQALTGDVGEARAEWLYLKANCERQLLKNEVAAGTYNELLASQTNAAFSDVGRYELAVTCFKMGKFREAVTEAGKLRQTSELKKDICWLLAEAYAQLKETDQAIQYYGVIVREFATNDIAPEATYRLAHLLQGKGELKEAGRVYGQVVERYPAHTLAPRALFAAAVCGISDHRSEDALRDLTALLKQYGSDPVAEEATYQKAMCEVRLQRYPEAHTTLNDLSTRYPGSKFVPDVHYWNGVMLADEKKVPEAEAALREALKGGAGKEWEGEAQFRLALSLQKSGKPDESAALLQGLMGSSLRDQFSPALLEWLAEFHYEKQHFKESADAARLIIDRGPDAAWQQVGWCLTGRGLLAGGDRPGAEAAYRKAMAVDVKTRLLPEASLRLGELLLDGTNVSEAVAFFQKAAELSRDDAYLATRARAYLGLAKAAGRAGDFENAARYYMSVAVLFDEPVLVPESLYEAAQAYRKAGKADAALKAIEELRARYPQSEWAKKPLEP